MSDLTLNKLVPLDKVVKAALLDTYSDVGQSRELFAHFAKRELDQLQTQTLKRGKRYCILPVSSGTLTSTLPIDYESLLGLYLLRNGIKIPLQINNDIINSRFVETLECEDKCDKCNQDRAICGDLVVTETVNVKTIDGTNYDETVIKKLYPNGDYYLETTTPVWDYDASPAGVDYVTTKKFIAHLDLKECGCLEDSETNLTTLQTCCPDIYGCYYASCSASCLDEGGSYKVFEENGLIQFDFNFRYSEVYIEYMGYLPKLNGRYMVPKVAFEALVEGVKYRAIRDRKNIPMGIIQMKKLERDQERRNLSKILNRVSIADILDAALRTPQFRTTQSQWYSNFCGTNTTSTTIVEDTCS